MSIIITEGVKYRIFKIVQVRSNQQPKRNPTKMNKPETVRGDQCFCSSLVHLAHLALVALPIYISPVPKLSVGWFNSGHTGSTSSAKESIWSYRRMVNAAHR
jgi:hypothetical protein